MDLLSHLDDGGVWLAAVVAGLGALGWLLRKAWRGYRNFDAFLKKADAVLGIAEYELQHNGGGSIKDAASQVPAIRDDLRRHAERFAEHVEQASVRDKRIAAMESAVESLAEALPIVARAVPHPSDAHLPMDDDGGTWEVTTKRPGTD